MYASSTFVFMAIVALARVAIATPPSCLLAALGAQPNPADLKSLCGTLVPQMEGNITNLCSGSASSAMSVYSSTCLAQGVTISVTSSVSSSSMNGSLSTLATISASSTGTGYSNLTTTTASATGSKPITAATGISSSTATAGSGGSNAGSSTSPQSALYMGSIILGLCFAGQFL